MPAGRFLSKTVATDKSLNRLSWQAKAVYMMTNHANGVLYVGVTSDLSRRVYEHREGLIAGFTKRYFLFYFVSGCIYLAMTLVSNYFISRLEAYVRRGQPKLA